MGPDRRERWDGFRGMVRGKHPREMRSLCLSVSLAACPWVFIRFDPTLRRDSQRTICERRCVSCILFSSLAERVARSSACFRSSTISSCNSSDVGFSSISAASHNFTDTIITFRGTDQSRSMWTRALRTAYRTNSVTE